ncbi:DUF4998 domain-containing protein [Fulvivirgaceae bacterium BMA10]|uniref:DUF4998 domain-containing protein n=1 Tax=Splendidivirga corallicola TaxID=3051826 RepID=A0ABT8KPT4_9BACT|nr:DUF4998 domain-containing protein [Fulvivirgaceae bacterium BMA10]
MANLKRIVNNKWIHLMMFSMIIVFSCETTEETYEEFTRNGETVYIGKADTVIVGPGFEKLRFWVVINADPKINKGLLETSDGAFMHEFDVVRTRNGQDTITFDLDLDEGEYTFDLYLLDDGGNRSIGREIQTTVFGEKYQASLLNRGIAGIDAFSANAVINWSDPNPGTIETILTYEDADGVMQTVLVSNEDNQTTLSSYKTGGSIVVSSTYKPTETAIEVFEAIPAETTFPSQFLLDKTLISALGLTGDATAGCWGSTYERLTDGSTDAFWHGCDIPEDQYPWVLSFDLGVAANLSGFRLDERADCCGGRSPANYQIWGTNDISGPATVDIDAGTIADWEADAEAKGWVKLLDVSGNNSASFEVEVPENATKFRYLRLVGISAIDGGLTANFNELTFWATAVE